MTGFVCVDKPEGITSFLTSKKVRRIFDEKKAGHTGTLDPMATGVLVVALGAATRFIELIPSHDKAYTASFLLGKTTDTLDITGKVLSESAAKAERRDVESVLSRFTGEISQLPPMYSAVKKDGVKLYQLARQGIEIEREERKVTIHSLELTNDWENEYEIEVSCSAGTYVRTLISDIGEALGCGAVMTKLRRVKANGADISQSFTLERLELLSESGELSCAVIPVDKMLSYPAVRITEAQAKRFLNGGELFLDRTGCKKTGGFRLMYSPEGSFLGVGEVFPEENLIKVKRVYNEA